MPFDPNEMDDLRLMTLAQLAKAGTWQLELAHDRAEHLLIWITRGQGVALLDGARHGIGIHNALFIPARNLMAVELMRNGYGQALVIPDGANLTLPRTVQHLRIRDAAAQAELTVLFEAMGREQNAQRPLYHAAMRAYGDLMAVWLRRHLPDDPAPSQNAARRLVTAFCDRLVRDYADGSSMAEHAEALGVTPTHLTRVCRAETGRTAATLLTERQLHAARTLLISTDVPVQDIARHLGFGSAAYFTRFIQQHTQKTPTALRKSIRSAA